MCFEDIARIPLRARDGSVRAYAIVDASDAEWANQWRWCLIGDYAARSIGRKGERHTVYLHREIAGCRFGDGVAVDHINRDCLDCRRRNLRIVPPNGNKQNRSVLPQQVSTYRGVYFDGRRRKWRAQIQVDGTKHYLGSFTTEMEAADAARAARDRLMIYAVD